MKNVRLFAVAAAMGMFATTVSAAAPVVTKDGYVATWGEVDEIVKVDVGDKVVMPTAAISVVKESRTTDTEYVGKTTTLGVSTTDKTCYVEFTNEVGKDSNLDGFVDAPILTMYPNASAEGWFYTDTKFFPSVKTSLYYIGQAGAKIYGARFLQPGSAEVKGAYHATNSHKDLASVEEVIAYLTEEGYIAKVDADADGYNDYVNYNKQTFASKNETYKGKTLGTIWNQITIPTTRNGETLLDEGLVNAFVKGHTFGANFIDSYNAVVTGAAEQVKYTVSTGTSEAYKAPFFAYFGKDDAKNTQDLNGKILVVTENRYGELEPAAIETTIATGSDLTGVGISGETDKVKVAILDRNGKYSLYSTIKVAPQKAWTIKKENNWSSTSGSFNASDVVISDTAANAIAALNALASDTHTYSADMAANSEGLVYYTAEANTSDKIVINTHGTGLTLSISGINTTKNVMTLYAPDGTEYTVGAVKLADGKWYPAVNNEEELMEFVEIFAGLHTPKSSAGWTTLGSSTATTYAWVDYQKLLTDNNVKSDIKYIDGTTESMVIPNELHHYAAKQCTYKVAEGTSTTATVTSNADAIDTTTAGVKTLTLTAKVGEDVVATKEVKVVVAPKYERVYKNGKVVKLTAKWLNGNTYAVYNYDWAAKTYTATFYANDGVTVAATSNGTL